MANSWDANIRLPGDGHGDQARMGAVIPGTCGRSVGDLERVIGVFPEAVGVHKRSLKKPFLVSPRHASHRYHSIERTLFADPATAQRPLRAGIPAISDANSKRKCREHDLEGRFALANSVIATVPAEARQAPPRVCRRIDRMDPRIRQSPNSMSRRRRWFAVSLGVFPTRRFC
jgi:hypothetical protein